MLVCVLIRHVCPSLCGLQWLKPRKLLSLLKSKLFTAWSVTILTQTGQYNILVRMENRDKVTNWLFVVSWLMSLTKGRMCSLVLRGC